MARVTISLNNGVLWDIRGTVRTRLCSFKAVEHIVAYIIFGSGAIFMESTRDYFSLISIPFPPGHPRRYPIPDCEWYIEPRIYSDGLMDKLTLVADCDDIVIDVEIVKWRGESQAQVAEPVDVTDLKSVEQCS